jgi:hypothetical protein
MILCGTLEEDNTDDANISTLIELPKYQEPFA